MALASGSVVNLSAQASVRLCIRCKQKLPALENKKSCSKCRENINNANSARRERAKKEREAIRKSLINQGRERDAENGEGLAKALGKRKAIVDTLDDSEVHDQETKTLKQMEKRLKTAMNDTRGNALSSTRITHLDKDKDANCVMYQTANDMYKDLRNKASSKAFQFHGSHSIVAVSSIDNAARGRLVAQELTTVAKLLFTHNVPVAALGGALTFKCACLTSASAAATSSGSENSEYKHNGLSQYIASSAQPSAIATKLNCKGRIVIIAEDDTSHVLGIKGQKITVKITH